VAKDASLYGACVNSETAAADVNIVYSESIDILKLQVSFAKEPYKRDDILYNILYDILTILCTVNLSTFLHIKCTVIL